MINTIDISGKWELFISEKELSSIPTDYSDSITLPDTLSNAAKVAENKNKDEGYLTDKYTFTGYAWFRRSLTLENDMTGFVSVLTLERTRVSTLYIDGAEVGTCDSLCSTHRYDISSYMTAGTHEIVICVANVGYKTGGGHMTSPDTQTNWLGIVGKMNIEIYPKSYISDVRVIASADGTLSVRGCVIGADNADIMATVTAPDGIRVLKASIIADGDTFEAEFKLENAQLWDEFERNVYRLTLQCGEDIYNTTFGFVTFSHIDRKLLVNGSESFLRGKHDGLIFPITGYAPCDVNEWKERLKIAVSYGINHYRFHTCCPPDAAFTAADELGIYMEPELPFWGTIAAKGEEGYNEEEQNYLINEGIRIIREFSHHPSFVMMSLGNELWGSRERLGEIIDILRRENHSIYFTSGSNNFQFWPAEIPQEDFFTGVRLSRDRLFRGSYAMCDAPLGHIQTDKPNTVHDYDAIIRGENGSENEGGGTIQIQYGTGVKTVKLNAADGSYIPHKPVISHEVGQYDYFPDFDEMKMYTGPLKPRYLDIFRERLEEKGLYTQWRDFFEAVGAHCTQCYKDEIETALRSSELSGFQLLDLQDFNGQGVSLVGVLNAFMQSKGFITPEDWRGFCDSNVLLARFDKYVYGAKEKPVIEILLSSYGKNKIKSGAVKYSLISDELDISGSAEFTASDTRLTSVGTFTPDFSGITKPQTAVLKLTLGELHNSYVFRLYPDCNVEITENGIKTADDELIFVDSTEKAKQLIASGKKAMVITDGSKAIENAYCADFWNYHMFRVISESMNKPVAPGTMGLLIDKDNKLLNDFPSEKFTTPQWYEAITHSKADILDDDPEITPIVQVVDNTERCHRLGMLYKKNGVLHCSIRLWEAADYPEIKQLAKSITENF